MNVLVAPDKFKGTLTASGVCDALERGLVKSGLAMNIRKFPLADGGEGTLDIFLVHTNGELIELEVYDPLMRKIKSGYGISGDGKTTFIEMANASGLGLLKPEEQNPMLTNTFGTGELIADALNRNVKKIILGIGGSATNDGALGASSALGLKAIDEKGNPILVTGKELSNINQFDLSDLHPELKHVHIIAICDVSNPFYGPTGAAYVYASQKGASPSDVFLLDNGLKHIAEVIKNTLGIDLQALPGSGAGGGFAGGAHALLGASLLPGTEVIFDLTHFNDALEWADIVITGEGKLDYQTMQGKLVDGLARKAFQSGKKVIVVCGQTELSEEDCKSMCIDSVYSLSAYAGMDAALHSAKEVLEILAQYELRKCI